MKKAQCTATIKELCETEKAVIRNLKRITSGAQDIAETSDDGDSAKTALAIVRAEKRLHKLLEKHRESFPGMPTGGGGSDK